MLPIANLRGGALDNTGYCFVPNGRTLRQLGLGNWDIEARNIKPPAHWVFPWGTWNILMTSCTSCLHFMKWWRQEVRGYEVMSAPRKDQMSWGFYVCFMFYVHYEQ